MPFLDDHYRRVAADNPKPRELRDAIPNGDDFKSRGFGIHKMQPAWQGDREAGGRMPRDFTDRKTREVPCPTCHAKPGAPCISQAKDRMGAELPGFHSARSIEAQQLYRKKRDA